MPLIKLVLISATRDRLFLAFTGLVALIAAASFYLGGAAIFESQETAIVLIAGAVRLAVLAALAVFTLLHIQRLFESRELESILATATPRWAIIINCWLGYLAAALLLSFPIFLLVFLLSPVPTGAALWASSLMMELAIVLALCVFIGFVLERALPSLAVVAAIYILGRLIRLLFGIAEAGIIENEVIKASDRVIEILFLVMPRLDLFGQTDWLIYAEPLRDDFSILAAQTFIYVALLLFGAIYDFSMKGLK